MAIGALIGAGIGLAGSLIQGNKQNELMRIREKEVDQALRQNKANRSRLLNQSPEAVRQQQSMGIQSGLAGAVSQAANVGAGQAASAGFAGGNVSSAQISGVKAATPVLQAAAPYQQAMANTYNDRQQQENTINQQLGGNTMDRGKLAEMTAYLDQQKTDPYQHIMSMVTGGATAGTGLEALFAGENMEVGNEPKIIEEVNKLASRGYTQEALLKQYPNAEKYINKAFQVQRPLTGPLMPGMQNSNILSSIGG